MQGASWLQCWPPPDRGVGVSFCRAQPTGKEKQWERKDPSSLTWQGKPEREAQPTFGKIWKVTFCLRISSPLPSLPKPLILLGISSQQSFPDFPPPLSLFQHPFQKKDMSPVNPVKFLPSLSNLFQQVKQVNVNNKEKMIKMLAEAFSSASCYDLY